MYLPTDQEEDFSSVASLALLSSSERKVMYTLLVNKINNLSNDVIHPTMYSMIDFSEGLTFLRDLYLCLSLSLSLQLCQSVGVEADEYLSCKSDIMRNSALKRSGYPGKMKLPRHLSSDQRSRLMSFFSKSGWTS